MAAETEDQRTARILRIREFSLFAAGYFEKAVPKSRSKIAEIIDDLLADDVVGATINSQDVKVLGDEWFNYTLDISIANDLVKIVLGSQDLRIHYQKGTSQHQLRSVINLFEKVFAVGLKSEASRTQIIHTFHGQFDDGEGFAAYNQKFADSTLKITSGGKIFAAEGSNFKGTAKLTIEPSAIYEDGLFAQVIAVTTEKFTFDLIRRVAARFEELFRKEDLEVKFEDENKS